MLYLTVLRTVYAVKQPTVNAQPVWIRSFDLRAASKNDKNVTTMVFHAFKECLHLE